MKSRFAAALFLAATVLPASAAEEVRVFLTDGCLCCHGWIEHIRAAGFAVTAEELPMGPLAAKKREAGLSPDLTSCHTAFVGGYVIEGHVPADLVARLLADAPDAVGLTAPGMPMGSPGMGDVVEEPYDVLLVHRDGSTEVYATIRG